MTTKYALVLSGGGFKGAFQLGALHHLRTHWKEITGNDGPMHFDIVAGVSVGALNGALVAQKRMDDLNALWDGVEHNGASEIFESPHIRRDGHLRIDIAALKHALIPGFRVRFGMVMRALWNAIRRIFNSSAPSVLEPFLDAVKADFEKHIAGFKGLATSKGLEDKLARYVSKSRFDPRTRFCCGIVSLQDGQYGSLETTDFANDTDLRMGILASAMMPIVWPPVKSIATKRGNIRNGVDGGVRNNSPLGDVIRRIQDAHANNYRIIIINCSNGDVEPMKTTDPSILRVALRSLTEITMSEIFNNDIDTFLRTNDLVRQAAAKGCTLYVERRINETLRKVPLIAFEAKIIQPLNSLGDTMDTTSAMIQERRELGASRAREAFASADWNA